MESWEETDGAKNTTSQQRFQLIVLDPDPQLCLMASIVFYEGGYLQMRPGDLPLLSTDEVINLLLVPDWPLGVSV